MEWIERHLMLIITVVWIAGIFWLRHRFVVGRSVDADDEDVWPAPRPGTDLDAAAPLRTGRG